MSMTVGAADEEEDAMNAAINTTPLVDIMLVLLIIFLITTPVITQSVKLELPKERNLPTQTKPENILLAVSKDGDVYWNARRMPDTESIVAALKKESIKDPQPEVHIRGDQDARYESVGRLVVAVPVVALQTARKLEPEVDEWVAALTPTHFWGVARWYYDFSQTTDQEVIALLDHAAQIVHPSAQVPHGMAHATALHAQGKPEARPL